MADSQTQKYPSGSLDSTSRINKNQQVKETQQVKKTQKQENKKQKTLKNNPNPRTVINNSNTETIRKPEITNLATLKKQSMFLPTSRLNRGQRKYCHCLMSVRKPKQSPYGICSLQSYRTMKANPNQRAFRFIPRKTNCIMNYDYNQYTLQDVQNLAVERGIPLSNTKSGKQNNKTTLVQLLTNRYINKHRVRKSNPE